MLNQTFLVDQIFGYDFFIAYTRRDGEKYANALAGELKSRDFKCFLDKSDFSAGDSLGSATERALRKSSALILVGSPRVPESKYVLIEVDLAKKLSRKVIPIDIDRTLEESKAAADLRNLLGDRIRIGEGLGSLEAGPTKEVTGSLLQAFNLTRQQTKRTRLISAAAFVFAIAAVSAVIFAMQANAANKVAEERRIDAETQAKIAVRQSRIATTQRNRADAQRQEAERQRLVAETQTRKAESATKEAIAQQERAEDALGRASARLLTMQARDESETSLSRGLLLSAAAVEATAKQNYTEASSEEFLHNELSQIRGRPLGVAESNGSAFLYGMSPDRHWALTSGPLKHPTLWQFEAKAARSIDLRAVENPEVIAFSPSSKFVAVGRSWLSEGRDGQVTIIPLATADRPETYRSAGKPAASIETFLFSPDGRFLLVAMSSSEDKPAVLFKIGDGGSSISEMSLQLPAGNQYGSTPVWEFSSGNRWLVSFLRADTSLLWDLRGGGVAGPYSLPSKSGSGDRYADFSSDLRWLVTYGYSDTARLWSLEDKAPASTVYDLATGRKNDLEHVKFSPDGQWVLADPCLWHLGAGGPAGQPICLTTSDDPGTFYELDFTSDSRRLVMVHTNETKGVSAWDLAAADPAKAVTAIKGERQVSADRHWMIQIPSDRPARLWDLRDGPVVSDESTELPGPPVQQAVFADDNSTLATSHTDGSIRIHSLQGAHRVQTVVLRESGIASDWLQFSPEGGWLLATSYRDHPDSQPALFKLAQGVTPVAIRLDDREVKFAGLNGRERAGDASSLSFKFSPGERWLVADRISSPVAYIWDLQSENVAGSGQLLKGHEYDVSYFDFVADESALVTSEFFDSMRPGSRIKFHPRLWSLDDMTGGIEPVVASDLGSRGAWAEFSPNGRLLATIGVDETLAVYRVEEGALHLALTRKGMGKGAVGRLEAGSYAARRREPFTPHFDKTGRWLMTASKSGQLYVTDCSLADLEPREIAAPLGANPFVAVDGEKSLLVSGVDATSNQLAVWDLSSRAPALKARLDIGWAFDINADSSPELRVLFLSKSEVAVVAHAKSGGRSEVVRYHLPGGERRMVAAVPIEREMAVSGNGYILAGSQGAFNLRTGKNLKLGGYVPPPETYRKAHSETDTHFEYLVSPDGRWVIGRRYILEGYPEFGRRLHYSWRWIFDLRSQVPQRPVLELPEVRESIFAEFSGDSKHWVSVSESEEATIVTLPVQGAPQVTTRKMDRFFAGRYLSMLPFWPTGGVSYEVSLSPKGDWLATRRGDLMYLIRLNEPFEGKLLRGFEAAPGFSSVRTFFGAKDDLAVIGHKLWRTRLDADLLWPVSLDENILAASANGKWVVTESRSGIAVHSMDVSRLIKEARFLAGRDLTEDEREQFLVRPQ